MKHKHDIRIILQAICFCFSISALCFAQTVDIDAWIWNVSSSGDIELTGDLGDQLDIGEELSIGEEWTPGATLIFGEGPLQIGASVFQLDLGGTEQVEQTFSFGGLDFNASADATTSLEMLVARGFLRFQLGEEAVSFALEGGGTYVDLDAKASAFDVFSTGADSQVALPYLGAEIRFEPISSVSLQASLRYSNWEYSDIETTWSEMELTAQWKPAPPFTVGGGYRRLAIMLDAPEEEISGDLVFDGPAIYVGLEW